MFFTLTVNVTSQLANAGIRFHLLDPNMGYFSDSLKNKNRVYVSVWGELGKTSYLRVGRNGSYSYKSIIGSGAWKREYIDVPQHSYLNEWINGGSNTPYVVDVLYNADAGIWGVAEPTMQCLDNFAEEIYQYRSLAERMHAANMVWFEPVGYRMYGTNREYVNFPVHLMMYNDPYFTFTAETIESTYPVVIDNKSRKGYEVRTTTANTAYWVYKPRIIVHGLLTDIN